MIELIFGVILLACGVGGVIFHKTHGWYCDVCHGERDFFETPWMDKRGMVGMCCIEKD